MDFGGSLLFDKLFGHREVHVQESAWDGPYSKARPMAELSSPALPVPLSCSGANDHPKYFSLQVYRAFLPATAVRLLKFLNTAWPQHIWSITQLLLEKGRRLMQRLSVFLFTDGELRISTFFPPLLLPTDESEGWWDLWPRDKALFRDSGDAGSAVVYLTQDDDFVPWSPPVWWNVVSFACPVPVWSPESLCQGLILLWVCASSCTMGFILGCCHLVLL